MSVMNDIRSAFASTASPVRRIILLNVSVFLAFELFGLVLWITGQPQDLSRMLSSWFRLPLEPERLMWQPWSLVTYAFMHAGLFHILFNMLVFFWFGNIFTDFNKKERVWGFYLLGAIGGALLTILAYQFIPAIHRSIHMPFMIGASAAVMCLVVATAVMVPNYELHLLLFGPVRIKYIALVYILLDLVNMPAGNAGGHVSHIGGALTGYFLMKQLQKGNDISFQFIGILNKFGALFRTKKPKLRVAHRQEYKKKNEDLPSQEQVDAILDKISRSGYDSLTTKEKELLFKASRND
jgi:membrane associated rhomboid family serine protease